jgi:RimJ/RimL family protein N-acetyltransferase/nitroimidazol reductase NimA-like FMN-containing flavoprotein (pyridoxamine 5'-phosphate oxidase superfamily)
MYPATPRTTANRYRDRLSYDPDVVHAILDEAYLCHLAFVVDGEPRALPTLHVRVGDTLYLHGSTGSRPLLAARRATGLPVSVAVTLLDGLVLARSQENHSANYRSVVAHGVARLVEHESDKRRVLSTLLDKLGAGRAADTRPPTGKELAETAVLALPLREVSAKVRAGGVNDDPADHGLPYWAGVIPLRLVSGRPQPDAGVAAPLPSYLRPARSPWLEPVPMRGRHVTLEPLDLCHVDDLFAATADDEVWRWLPRRRPADRDDMAATISEALDAWHAGTRVPWVQRDATTGDVIGTTSYYAIDPANRTVAIGHTFIGRRWWRTGVNTESKLLLLSRAFGDLAAERVEWHTDVRNERSQRAIERLGATREGVLRRHRPRPDGSWRDTVLYSMTADEWPAARDRLTAIARRPAS